MPTPSPEPTMLDDDLGPCCDEVRCSWQPIPHIHEDGAVYPAPPDRVEWIAALATDEAMPHD